MKPRKGSAPKANSITLSHELEISILCIDALFYFDVSFFPLQMRIIIIQTHDCLTRGSCLTAKAKEMFALSQVLQNWSHRSYKKLQWHLAEQLLFLACYCESGYITFGGFLRTKLTARNKLNLLFLQKRRNKQNESPMSRVR